MTRPPPITIDDPDDPRIAGYRDIREADLVGRQGCFIAEGEVVLRVLLGSSRHAPISLLIDRKRIERLAPLLDKAPADVPIYSAGRAVLDAIVGFPIHRGVLALGRRAPAQDAAALLTAAGKPSMVMVLFGIANHDNMGGLLRNAAAFGVGAVLLDAQCCDPLYRKAIRVSVGGALLAPFARLSPGEDAIGLLQGHGFTPLALSPRAHIALADLPRINRPALMLGAEGAGLSEALIHRALAVRIPMSGGFDSLNVATASGVALHHLACGFAADGPLR